MWTHTGRPGPGVEHRSPAPLSTATPHALHLSCAWGPGCRDRADTEGAPDGEAGRSHWCPGQHTTASLRREIDRRAGSRMLEHQEHAWRLMAGVALPGLPSPAPLCSPRWTSSGSKAAGTARRPPGPAMSSARFTNSDHWRAAAGNRLACRRWALFSGRPRSTRRAVPATSPPRGLAVAELADAGCPGWPWRKEFAPYRPVRRRGRRWLGRCGTGFPLSIPLLTEVDHDRSRHAHLCSAPGLRP